MRHGWDLVIEGSMWGFSLIVAGWWAGCFVVWLFVFVGL